MLARPREDALRTVFTKLWGASDGRRLADRLLALMIDAKNPTRWCNQPEFEQKITATTRDLEQEFLAWQPS
jgi:hypothetical protein